MMMTRSSWGSLGFSIDSVEVPFCSEVVFSILPLVANQQEITTTTTAPFQTKLSESRGNEMTLFFGSIRELSICLSFELSLSVSLPYYSIFIRPAPCVFVSLSVPLSRTKIISLSVESRTRE
jgi:hypothetical protein